MEFIKSLDVYKKLPSDIVEPTYSGTICKYYLSLIFNSIINYNYFYYSLIT